jgi:hypothetical protein
MVCAGCWLPAAVAMCSTSAAVWARPVAMLTEQQFVVALLLLAATTGDAATTAPKPCRDRFLEPFSSSSIWNTAIGSKAVMAAANLFVPASRHPTQFHNDQDFFLRVTPADTMTDWVDQGDWGADDHCKVHGKTVSKIRLPKEWTSASDCVGRPSSSGSNCRSKGNQPNNNAMGVLLEDNETIVQMQPAYRCGWGSPLLAKFGNSSDGCPQQFPNITSIFGDGERRIHTHTPR